MKLECIQHADVAFDGEGILAQEEVFVAGKAEHRIAGADALEVANADPDERCSQTAAQDPRRRGRGIEGEAIVMDFNRVDGKGHMSPSAITNIG